VSASALAFDEGWHVPEALDEDGHGPLYRRFVHARAGALPTRFEVIELHSRTATCCTVPLARSATGASRLRRSARETAMRFPLEVLEAVSAVVRRPRCPACASRPTTGSRAAGRWTTPSSTCARHMPRIDYVCVCRRPHRAGGRCRSAPATRCRLRRASGRHGSRDPCGRGSSPPPAGRPIIAGARRTRWHWARPSSTIALGLARRRRAGAEVHCPRSTRGHGPRTSWRALRDAAG